MKAKSASPQFKVVEHRPWQRSLILVAFAVTALGGLLLGARFGQHELAAGIMAGSDEKTELAALAAQLQLQDAQLIDMQLNVDVQHAASNALRDDLTAAHNEAANLREEVTFYKGLMSPSSVANGLQIPEIELVELDVPGQFRYRLLMTQVALRRSYIAGEVRIDVIGQYRGDNPNGGVSQDQVVLSLTDLAQLKAYPLKFRFRYFQDLAGSLTLPEGFEPERLLVTANEAGKTAHQVTFTWSAQIHPQ